MASCQKENAECLGKTDSYRKGRISRKKAGIVTKKKKKKKKIRNRYEDERG